jgi:uncharacterized protein with PIN domain
MKETTGGPPKFACDAMLGGLARWLRAAGYDASWRADIDDWDLVRLALREGSVLLSSDTGIFRIGVVRDGEVPALFVPHGLGKFQQLAFVLKELGLRPLAPRCMACGGALRDLPPEEARPRVPARTFAWVRQFFQCERCGQLFWPGTHWARIADALRRAVPQAE